MPWTSPIQNMTRAAMYPIHRDWRVKISHDAIYQMKRPRHDEGIGCGTLRPSSMPLIQGIDVDDLSRKINAIKGAKT